MGIQIGGLIGVLGGAILGIAGWYFGRRQAAKERGIDEVHDHIWRKAKSYSWYVTLFTIYILFFLYSIGFSIGTAPALGIVLLVQLFSWAIVGITLSSTIYNEDKGHKYLIKFLIAYFLIFTLTIIILLATGVISL